MNAIAIIPARYASTRFPAKPLARETGRFLIQHVHERVIKARSIRRVIVATDDQRIADAVRSFGGDAAMTRPDHPCGTDRIAEVARNLDADIILNVQGDEPEIEPGHIDRLVACIESHGDCNLATLACPFARCAGIDPADPAAVKVVIDQHGKALYFSRSLIPHPRNATDAKGAGPFLHLGIYAFRRDFLFEFAALQPTPLEQTEGLEQLRALENGRPIAVQIVDSAAAGIDTPQDYAAFVDRWRARAIQNESAQRSLGADDLFRGNNPSDADGDARTMATGGRHAG